MNCNLGFITYACGCRYEGKFGGCAKIECSKVCQVCRCDIRASSSINDGAVRKIVFRMAWEAARRGAAKFGGTVRSFFAVSLKQAYAFASTVKNGFKIEVVRETSSAVLARHEDGSEIWWPLSQVEINGSRLLAPEWLISKKFAA
jgi:hypothetical protein